jgi:proline iminopeptidase
MELHAAVNGTDLYYELAGAGRPVLTMHGAGLDHACFRPWLDPLGDVAQWIFYDHRGHGRSERPKSLDTVGPSTWNEDADALRASLGHEKIVVFGHSFGGALAQIYALDYGDRLAGLILCSTAPALDYLPEALADLQLRATPEQLAMLQANGAGAADDTAFRRAWMTLLPIYFKSFNPEIGMAMDRATHYSGAGYARAASCLAHFNTVEKLGQIKCPTLVIGGAADWTAPPKHTAARLAEGIAGAELVIFEESGHFPFVEEPDRFRDVVRAFLGKLPAP